MYHLHLNWENPAVLSIAGSAISDGKGASRSLGKPTARGRWLAGTQEDGRKGAWAMGYQSLQWLVPTSSHLHVFQVPSAFTSGLNSH